MRKLVAKAVFVVIADGFIQENGPHFHATKRVDDKAPLTVPGTRYLAQRSTTHPHRIADDRDWDDATLAPTQQSVGLRTSHSNQIKPSIC